MLHFLRHVLLLMCLTAVMFVFASALSGHSRTIEWLLFQPVDDFNSDGHTVAGIEEALASGEQGGLLVVGSSVCKNSIHPAILSEQIGMPVLQMCTGGQSVQGALAMAGYLSERLHPDVVLLDLYPRTAPSQVVEGVMRVLLATPDARTDFARFNAIGIYSDWNSQYLWARAWVSSWFGPLGVNQMDSPPGYMCVSKPPMKPSLQRQVETVDDLTLDCITRAARDFELGTFFVNLPPLHGASFELEERDEFKVLPSGTWPDTCFFDTHHMRCQCSKEYTLDLAQRIKATGLLSSNNRQY